MANGDPFFHVTRALDRLSDDMRDLRSDMDGLRRDLANTRETVARMQGAQDGEDEAVDRRSRIVEIVAASGVVLGALATIHPF